MNPDTLTSCRSKLVSNARAIVTYEVGLPLGCTRMTRLLYWLQQHGEADYPVFEEYRRATSGLPTGQERLHWERSALARLDVRLEAINRDFRDRVFEACYAILDRSGDCGGTRTEKA